MVEVREKGDAERPCEDHGVHNDVVQWESFDVVQRHAHVILRQRRIGQDLTFHAVVLLEAEIEANGGKEFTLLCVER